MIYEAYLALTLYSFEPFLFFIGLFSYWALLYKGLPSTSSSSSPLQNTTQIPLNADEVVAVPNQEGEGGEEEEEEDFSYLETNMDVDTEEAMMKDEHIMSEWRDLLTRAWKTSQESSVAEDMSSVMSKSSRFNEEDYAPSTSVGSSDDDDDDDEEEELGFDPNTLEMYLSQYDQIKKDAQLAKKLQIQEQKARDENNPFVIEDMAVGKSHPQDQNTNPKASNDADKEGWKISVFPRQV
jgi:hypothetical protein